MSEYEEQVLLVNKIGSKRDAAVLKSLVALALHKFLPDVKILWDAMLGVTNKHGVAMQKAVLDACAIDATPSTKALAK